jgi:hypothetical protein
MGSAQIGLTPLCFELCDVAQIHRQGGILGLVVAQVIAQTAAIPTAAWNGAGESTRKVVNAVKPCTPAGFGLGQASGPTAASPPVRPW